MLLLLFFLLLKVFIFSHLHPSDPFASIFAFSILRYAYRDIRISGAAFRQPRAPARPIALLHRSFLQGSPLFSRMSTTHTSTITEVIQTLDSNQGDVADLVPFSSLLASQTSYAAVDNSGSTGGAPLRVAKNYVTALGVNLISLWNSYCNPPALWHGIRWMSTVSCSAISLDSHVNGSVRHDDMSTDLLPSFLSGWHFASYNL